MWETCGVLQLGDFSHKIMQILSLGSIILKHVYGKKSQITCHISGLNKVKTFKGIGCA
jgi:hypothetical protein